VPERVTAAFGFGRDAVHPDRKETAMKQRVKILLLVALVAGSAACFEIRGTHTLYLDPDGSVTWAVFEEEIRLEDEPQETDRWRYRSADTIQSLYPGTLTVLPVREREPMAIYTEADFPGIDVLYRNLFSLFEMVARVELEVGEDGGHLVMWVWVDDEEELDEEEEAEAEDERSQLDEILLAPLVDCEIVLTEGWFVAAEGFEILPGRRAVKPDSPDTEEAEENGTPIRMSLTWSRFEPSGSGYDRPDDARR
jgi:hypothetical protein